MRISAGNAQVLLTDKSAHGAALFAIGALQCDLDSNGEGFRCVSQLTICAASALRIC